MLPLQVAWHLTAKADLHKVLSYSKSPEPTYWLLCPLNSQTERRPSLLLKTTMTSPRTSGIIKNICENSCKFEDVSMKRFNFQVLPEWPW